MRLIRVQLISKIDGTARAALRGVMLTWLAPLATKHDTNTGLITSLLQNLRARCVGDIV